MSYINCSDCPNAGTNRCKHPSEAAQCCYGGCDPFVLCNDCIFLHTAGCAYPDMAGDSAAGCGKGLTHRPFNMRKTKLVRK